MEKIERICEKMKPDVVFYVDRLDNQGREFQDISVINSITKALGEEIWFNAIVVFTHAAVAPPDGRYGQELRNYPNEFVYACCLVDLVEFLSSRVTDGCILMTNAGTLQSNIQLVFRALSRNQAQTQCFT